MIYSLLNIFLAICACVASGVLICSVVYDVRRTHAYRQRKRRAPKLATTTSPEEISQLPSFFRFGFFQPFVKTARLLRIRPAMSRTQRKRKRIVLISLRVGYFFTAAAILYAIYAIIIFAHIGPAIYILALALSYAIATIILHDELTWKQKCYMVILLPAALWYFLYSCYRPALERLTNMIKAKVPVSVSLFMRIKNVLRIV